MKVWYQNALKTASLSMTGLVSGDDPLDLIQQDLERTVNFSGASSVITASWTARTARAGDALFISNTNALQGTLKLYDQTQALTRTIRLRLGRWNNKTAFPSQAVGKIELTLQAPAGTNLYVGLVFLSLGTVLPRFAVGVDMGDEIRGEGDRSHGGQTYGMEGVTLETFSAPWSGITAEERRVMRRYIDSVQHHVNHYINPYEGVDMYVTIEEAGEWKKHDSYGFYWDTSLKYLEAK
jgi:hypothetical protein